jgi:SET domain-containing protein
MTDHFHCFIHPGISVGDTPHKGRGIFSRETLPADLLIEKSPVLVMDAAARVHLDRTLLHDYIFEWQPDGALLCCMALGYVPVYNHSYTSNCEYFMDYETQTMSIKTIRIIAAGEELTINYNGDWDDERPVWFEVKA